jgi:predicted translin family RNA/ssDNA-binding protein
MLPSERSKHHQAELEKQLAEAEQKLVELKRALKKWPDELTTQLAEPSWPFSDL